MNCNTGELISAKMYESLYGENFKGEKNGFTPVPEEYEAEALEILNGEDSAVADLSKNTPLMNWAKQNNSKALKNKAKKKAAKKGRRINRK